MPPQSFADSHSVGMVGWGAQEGVRLVSPLDTLNPSSAQTGCWVGTGIHGPQRTRNNSFLPHHPEGPAFYGLHLVVRELGILGERPREGEATGPRSHSEVEAVLESSHAS